MLAPVGPRMQAAGWQCLELQIARETQDEAKDLGSSRPTKKSTKFRTARATPSMPEWSKR